MAAIHISLAAEPIAHLGSFAITNSMVASLVASVALCALFIPAARRTALAPQGRLSQLVESVMEMLLSLIESIIPDRRRALQVFPLTVTLFFFILFNNWLGLLPGVGSITVETAQGSVPLLRGATADLNTTIALAIISVVMTHVYALRELGFFKHLKKYVSLNPIMLFVSGLEIISELSRAVSFSFRLFGNIFAGEVLLAYLSPALAPLPFFALELLVGLVQALVFTTLTLVFLGIAASEHGGHEHTPSIEAGSPAI